MVPPQVPIVTFEPGRRDDLKAGAHVVMFVRADAQGTLVAQRVLVGKDGQVLEALQESRRAGRVAGRSVTRRDRLPSFLS